MGIRDQLLWRRDWSVHPNAWKLHLGFAITWLALGVLYIAADDLFGIGYLALAAAWVWTARYTYRRSHQRPPNPGPGQEGSEAH